MKIVKNSFALRFFGYFCSIFIILLTLVVYIYFNNMQLVMDNAYKSQLALLKQSSNIVDNDLLNMQCTAYNLQCYLPIQKFFTDENPSDDSRSVLDIIDVNSYITSLLSLNGSIDNIFIYSQKSGILINRAGSNNSFDDGRSSVLIGKDGNSTINYLNKTYQQVFEYHVPISISGVEGNYLVYSNSVPLLDEKNVFNISILMNEQKVLKLFDEVTADKISWVYICDKKGNLVTQKNAPDGNVIRQINAKAVSSNGYLIQNINGCDMFITYVKNDRNAFSYVSAVRLKSITSKTENVRNLLGILIILTSVFSIIIIIFFTLRSTAPINKIIKMLTTLNSGNRPVTYNYDYIQAGLKELINDNEEMKQGLATILQKQKATVFSRLLEGNFYNGDELLEGLDTLDIPAQAMLYAVLIVSLNDVATDFTPEIIGAQKLIVNRALYDILPATVGAYDIDYYSAAFIIPSNFTNYIDLMQEIEQAATKAYNKLRDESNILLCFSCSIARCAHDISEAYSQAKISLNYKQFDKNLKVLWFKKQCERSDLFFYYPIEMENNLLTSVLEGDVHNCRTVFESIYKYNFTQRQLPEEIRFQLISSLLSTLYRVSEKLTEQHDQIYRKLIQFTDSINKKQNAVSIFNAIKKYCIYLSGEIKLDKCNQSQSLITGILSYINIHYTDPMISLSAVADEFNITEIYLSRLFKEQTKQNFSKYIEHLRMEEACRLLTVEQLKVSDVARMVGYNYVQVFNRVYKKYFGKTPTEK